LRDSVNALINHDAPPAARRRSPAPARLRHMAGSVRTLNPGDIVVVTKLDRLARSGRDLHNILHKLAERGCGFVSLGEAWLRHLHSVPDRPRLAGAVRDVLRPNGRFAIVNWHQRPREQTTVLGEQRGPKTELRLSPVQTMKGWWRVASSICGPSRCRLITMVRCSSVRGPDRHATDFEQQRRFGTVGLPARGLAAGGATAKGPSRDRCATVCILDPDGDIVRLLRQDGRARPCEGWPCYHTGLDAFELGGQTVGIVGCAVGAPFAARPATADICFTVWSGLQEGPFY
jgi:hypothetical protein